MERANKKRKAFLDEGADVQPSAKKRKITVDLVETKRFDPVLPPEIMIEIMEYLVSSDIESCALVCKYWLACSREVQSWILVGSEAWTAKIQENYSNKVDDLFSPLSCMVDLLERADKPQKQVGSRLNIKWHPRNLEQHTASFLDDKGEVVTCTDIFPMDGAWYQRGFVYNYFKSFKDEIPVDYTGYRVEFYIARNPNCWSDNLQNMVYSDKEFPLTEHIVKNHVNREVDKLLEREYDRIAALEKPVLPELSKIEQIELKNGLKFHEYQLNAISWMKRMESTDHVYQYNKLVRWNRSKTNVLFDLHYSKAVKPQQANASAYVETLKSKGAVLADESGLGKTVEVIGLILSSPSEQLPEFDENGLFNTKASLVICPNHLAMQWSQEVSKYTDLKVSMLSFQRDLKTVTYNDIIDSDVVIMTSQMFKDRNYLSLGCGETKFNSSIQNLEKRKKLINERLKELKKERSRLSTVGPVLEHFHFKRIIVDEAHEVLSENLVDLCIYALTKTFAWYVSSTPFPLRFSFDPAKKLFEIWKPDCRYQSISTASKYDQYLEDTTIVSNLLWRNTKESVKQEYQVPVFAEEIIKPKFHPIEALLHEYATSDEDKRRLCNGSLNILPKSAKNATLDDLKDWWIADLKRKIQLLRDRRAVYGKKWSVDTEAEHERHIKVLLDAPYVVKNMKLKGKKLKHALRVNQYGTKCTELMTWMSDAVTTSSSNRFALFSADNDYLHKLGARLRDEGFMNVIIAGNIVQKSNALKQFREQNITVALLNSGEVNSGMKLHVNYVVLLDPVILHYWRYKKEDERACEIRALGLAHHQKVALVRFVIQESIEEKLFVQYKSALEGGSDEDS